MMLGPLEETLSGTALLYAAQELHTPRQQAREGRVGDWRGEGHDLRQEVGHVHFRLAPRVRRGSGGHLFDDLIIVDDAAQGE
jgi:hypothetical protein